MSIHSFTKVLSLPLLLIVVAMLYNGWTNSSPITVYIFIPVILLVALYNFQGLLDHWWLTRFPIPFDPKLKEWLTNNFTHYVKMEDELQRKFEYRLSLYLNGRLFQSVGSEMRDVPEDIKCMVAAHGVYMTSGLDDYLIGDIDRVFLYKHPFPSPKYAFLHHVETDVEDGVIILSLEQLVNAVLKPHQFYNIAFHAYAEAIVSVYKKMDLPLYSEESWADITSITGWDKDSIVKQIGYYPFPLYLVHISIFFTFPEKYKMILPVYYERLALAFNYKP